MPCRTVAAAVAAAAAAEDGCSRQSVRQPPALEDGTHLVVWPAGCAHHQSLSQFGYVPDVKTIQTGDSLSPPTGSIGDKQSR